MARLALIALFVIGVLARRQGVSAGRHLQETDYHLVCEVFDKDIINQNSPLYNPNFADFNSLLVNVLNWGDTYLQTRWCGSGGFLGTVLAPTNAALAAGFQQLHQRFGLHANPLDYVIDSPWTADNNVPLALAIDAIAEAGMMPGTVIDLYNDTRVPVVNSTVTSTAALRLLPHFSAHSSIVNRNPDQVLHFWRNATDGFVYVYLPKGVLPGPYRVLDKTKRHVTNCATCFPSNEVYVYEVEGLLVPGNVALGLLYTKRAGISWLGAILRSIGPNGYHVMN